MSAICSVFSSMCDEKNDVKCSACDKLFLLTCLKTDSEGVKNI